MAQATLSQRLDDLRRQLRRLPEIEELPPTTLQLLGQSRQEGDWQRFLAYFLSPDAPHGLEHAAIEQFLEGLRDRDDIGFTFSRFDLDEIQVATEVPIGNGRIDLLIWAGTEWFVLCELKIDATEGDSQTVKYANAESFETVNLNPTDVPADRRHYLYVTPDRARPESNCFTPVAWSWVATQLRAVQAADYGSFPARTTGQLDDFIDTIDTELTMTDHERNETAKASLYVDYFDEIDEVHTAFQSGWDDLIDNWGRRLATTLDAARLVEEPESGPTVPAEHVMFDLPDGGDRRRNWLCRQGNGEWAWFFPTDWWTNLEDGSPTYRGEKPNARVGFLHRPEFDREAVLGDHELRVYLRNAPSGNEEFYPRFAERFNADETIGKTLPDAAERHGRKSNVLEATYPIDIDGHESLFTAYIDALATAVGDLIISDHTLVERIDEIYQETLVEVRETRSE